MVISNVVKRLGIIASILIAALLAYGLIDANGYRAGYKAGYGSMGRLVDAACANGLVLDNNLCVAAETALHSAASAVSGLASVTDNLIPSGTVVVSRPRKIRKPRKAVISTQSQVDTASVVPIIETVAVPVLPVQPVVPIISPATQKMVDRIDAAKKLSDTYCLQYGVNDCSSGFPWCSKVTGVCAFTSITAGVRSIPADQVIQSPGCLKPDILSLLGGVGTFVKGAQVSICANPVSGGFVYLSMPGERLSLSELIRNADPILQKFAKDSGASVAPVVTAPVRPSCSSFMGSNTPMPAGGCEPDMNMMPMQGYVPPRQSSVYKPSTLAQFISVILGLFNR